jgi:predicted transposase/invertase (TIGR01784 family)
MDVILRANPRVFVEVQTMAKRRETLEEVFTEAGLIPEWMERGRKQGLEMGLEKGKEQGREEGKEQGLEKGKEIIARNLLKMGMSVEEIAQATELPVKKIRAFQK